MAADLEMNEIHWLMDMFNTVDVGLVVLDRDYKVCVWNGFMENHSGLLPSAVKDKDLFDLFPAILCDSRCGAFFGIADWLFLALYLLRIVLKVFRGLPGPVKFFPGMVVTLLEMDVGW